jgi:hypothetical protein
MNERIVGIIGLSVGLCILGTFTLSALSKTPPEWAGDAVKMGLAGLVGLVTGAATVRPSTPSEVADATTTTTTEETKP